MKKFMTAAVATMAVATVAFASSINVPFFLDWEQVGVRGFIGIKNNTNEAIELSIFYRDVLGQNRTPGAALGNLGADFVDQGGNPVNAGDYNSDPGNTFVIGPNASLAFRPATDSLPKGLGAGGEAPGIIVPKMMGSELFVDGAIQLGNGEFSPWNGSAEIRWPTVETPSDIQGRYLQTTANAQSSYLLPPGIATD